MQTALAYLDAFYAGEALKLTTLDGAPRARGAGGRRGPPGVVDRQQPGGAGADRRRAACAEDESAEVRQQQSAARVGAAALGRAPADELCAPSPRPSCRPSRTVRRRASGGRGHAARHRGRAAEAARRRGEPQANWTWEVSYGQRTGYSDMVSFGVSIPLHGGAGRAPGPRHRGQAGAGRQGRGRARGSHARRHRRIPGAGQRRRTPAASASSATSAAS